MLNCFIGFDNRQTIATNVMAHSIAVRASKPVAITPLRLETLPIERRGLTSFTFSRFLVPWLLGYKGWGLFVDPDMVMNCDVAEIFALADPQYAVMVVDCKPEFERAALLLFNAEHPDCRGLTPEFIESAEGLLMLDWTRAIGYLPMHYLHNIGYSKPEEDPARLGVVHWTMGLPMWSETEDSPHAELWHAERRDMCSVRTSWQSLMGNSVHVKPGPNGEPVPKYKA
jgi:hypothetical protein